MGWLVSEGRVLASCETLTGHRAKGRGLLGRDELEGAMVLKNCRWVHTMGMRFALDVAYIDELGIVVKTVHMRRHRVGAPVWRAQTVIEAQEGAFGRWGLRVGDVLEIRDSDTGVIGE